MTLLPKVTVPEGKSGDWKIERFTVSELDARIDAFRSGRRAVRAGTYTRLLRGGHVIMSDTPAEMWDHYEPVRRARGAVLINGLGLGMVLQAVLAKPDVTDVTVIEASPDVIALVAPHYTDPRVTIMQADAIAYCPPAGKRYAVVWHDIWDDICADNLPEMHRLHRKYGRRCDWQGSWARDLCECQARRAA